MCLRTAGPTSDTSSRVTSASYSWPGGSCRWRHAARAAAAIHAAFVAAAATLALPKSLPLATALVSGRLIVLRQVFLHQHDAVRLTRSSSSEQWHGGVLQAAGRAARAAVALSVAFRVRHHPPQVHRRGRVRPRARSNERRVLLLLRAASARAPNVRECACVPAFCWQLREHAGAAEKGHSRVRHFAGVVTFPVV